MIEATLNADNSYESIDNNNINDINVLKTIISKQQSQINKLTLELYELKLLINGRGMRSMSYESI